MTKFIVFLAFIVLNIHINGQVIQFGPCPEVETVKFFDVERFQGRWYEIQRYPAWFEDKGSCAYKEIQLCGNRVIEFHHVFVKDDIQYIMHVNSTYNPGDEPVFEIEPNTIDTVGIPISVVDTDYNNYAVLHGCRVYDELNIRYTSAYILSRDATLDPDHLEKARNALNTVPYASLSFLEDVPHEDAYCTHHWTANVNAVNINSVGN